MHKDSSGKIIYSPSDLVQFMESSYASWMERLHLENPSSNTPDSLSDDERLAMQSGARFEKEYVAALKARGEKIVSVADSSDPTVTIGVMRKGQPLIYQGSLAAGNFVGRPDFLVQVEGKSTLGGFHYTVRDTKLAKAAKPHYIIQLCMYADMLEHIQGVRPARFSVVFGTGAERLFRTDDFFYFYLSLKDAFLEWMASFDPSREAVPDLGGEYRRWSSHAEAYFRKVDHLWLTANITQLQVKRLGAAGITTLAGLATTTGKVAARINSSAFMRLTEQAQVQVESREKGKLVYRVIKPSAETPRSGLALLPPVSSMDVFFDMEGYPYLEEGREYLFGAMAGGDGTFHDWWGHDVDEERVAFEAFVDWAFARWEKDHTMHIYHYAAYEVSALRRLMGRHGTREQEIDDLLRNGVFVDVLTLVRGGMRIGAETYKLKDIESLYWAKRAGDVKSAVDSMVVYQRWLDSGEAKEWKISTLLKRIREYNAQDCESLCRLVTWLRERQIESGILWVPIPATPSDTKEMKDAPKPGKVTKEDQMKLAVEILKELPSERERAADRERWRLPEMLGYLVEFHRREDKPAWWRLFDRDAAAARGEFEALVDDLDCIGDLRRNHKKPDVVIDRSMGFWYEYDPDQDTKLEEGDKVVLLPDPTRGFTEIELNKFDSETGEICVKIGPKPLAAFSGGKPPEHCGLTSKGLVNSGVLATSVFECTKHWKEAGKLQPALEDFLLRRPPRIRGGTGGQIVGAGEDAGEVAVRIVGELDSSCLYIQGPPGAGKTTTGARLIVKLASIGARRGMKIGVTGNSHKVIINLLGACMDEAARQKINLSVGKVGKTDSEDFARLRKIPIIETKDLEKALPGLDVVGGTAWCFSAKNAAEKFDCLFVDEAGQVSVANLVGMARAAKNIILLGDQMQLSQPIQGAHPGDSGLSVLDYLLEGNSVIQRDRGIFLDRTWRLHPDLCRFISETFYEGHLLPRAGTEVNKVIVHTGKPGRVPIESGLLYVPVVHEGNSQSSPEEAKEIKAIVGDLLGRSFTAAGGKISGKIKLENILFVAPYNMQVNLIRRVIPGAKVGSVDKFQGQEAPVVIVSMCASEGEISTRGLDFLFSKNRLNVAVSRAQCLAIVVGSPVLARSRCASLKHLMLCNTFCRLVREGTPKPSK